VPAQVAADKPV